MSTAEFPLLTSTIQETLRYTTYILPIRRVTEPVEFGGYRFDAGDEVLCLTRSVHFDEEIHVNASVYDPGRYMKQKRFSKNGETVANHSMPRGGGVSMCEGRSVFVHFHVTQVQFSRHFATRELKAFMVLMLMQYTIEIDTNSSERPSFKWERIGAGIMHPRGDVRVILRARD